MKHTREGKSRGITVLLVLVFAGAFALSISALVGYVIAQSKASRIKVARESAAHIAEAGLEYYKWFLAHYPNDLKDGTGVAGPYVHTYTNLEEGEGAIGQFSLDITGNSACGVVQSIDIASTGWTHTYPMFTRTFSARYMRPSAAEYSSIINVPVVFGSTTTVQGPVHGNSGIIMNGMSNSLVTATPATWYCDTSVSSTSCNPAGWKPGVFGSGSDASLWQYPSDEVDFDSIGTEVLSTKPLAQSSGVYLAAFSGGSDTKGYHLRFKSNGTVDVYRVNTTDTVWAQSSAYGYTYSSSYNWRQSHDRITGETFLGNYTVPSNCSLIYSEEKLWLEGVVSGKVTVVAAQNGSYDPDILIMNNITYATGAGVDGLTAVAENYLLIAYNVPTDLVIHGIFVAIKGRFGRDYYSSSYVGSYAVRDSLTIIGTTVSSGKTSVTTVSGGTVISGFEERYYYYDAALIPAPPPFTPKVSPTYRFYLWREQ